VGLDNTSTVFSGIMSDGMSTLALSKSGSGQLILTGSNDFSGGTTIKMGTLSVGSDHALGNGNVRVEVGVLQSYGGPRDIHVRGNYVQLGTDMSGAYTGGILRLGLGGTGAGQSDRLVVAGTAALAGTLDLVRLNGYAPKVGDKIQLVSAGGGVSGQFVEVENPFATGTIVDAGVVYEPNAVFFEAVQGSFAGLDGLTPNQKAVAHNLDDAVGDSRAHHLINYLDAEPLGRLPHDFDLIAPEELAALYNIGVSLANVQSANLQRRTGDVRAGSAGFSAAGYAVSGGGPSYSSGGTNYGGTVYAPGARGPEGKGGKELRAPEENRWGVFITGVGEFTSIGDTTNARGYDLTTGGFTLGADYKLTPNFALGVVTGYANTGADLTGHGNVRVNAATLGLYATYFTGTGFYIDAAATGGFNSYDTRRGALQGRARGSTDGGEFDALFATGYDWKAGALTIGPTASFEYTYLGLQSFTEHGSLAPLRFGSQNEDSLRTAVGLKASYDWRVGGVVIRPEVRAAWQHEFGDSSYALVSSLASGAGGAFSVQGPQIGDDSLLLGAGFAVLWNERTSTYVYYDGELARTNYHSNNVSGGLRLAF
jgi:outer membrane autotransporter protein